MSGESGQKQAAVWLVKSGGRILGPYTEEDLCAKIRSREFLVIDEVTLPMSRWRVIRDEPTFARVVEEVRKGQLNTREDTEVQGHTQTFTQTDTETITQTLTQSKTITLNSHTSSYNRSVGELEYDDEEETRENSGLSSMDAIPIDPNQVRDAEFVDISDYTHKSNGFGATPVREYGLVGSVPASSSSIFNLRNLAWSAAVVVCGVAFWLFMRSSNSRTQPSVLTNTHDFKRVVNEATSAWEMGDFPRALSLYRQADSMMPGQPEVVSRLAPLLIHLESQTVAAKRAIRDAMKNLGERETSRRAELELGLSLAALASDEYNEAETHCRSATAAAPSWFPARFVCGVVYFQKKDYLNASQNFNDAGDEPAALFMNARSLLALNRISGSSARERARAVIEKLITRHQDFRQEGLVIAAYLELESGNKKGAVDHARAALDIDPQQTNDHWHDPYLYLEPLSWNSLVPYCRQLAEGVKAAATRALLGLCLFKSGNRTEAGEIIRDGVAQSTGADLQLLQAVNAYIMAESGRYDDARAALKIALKQNPPALAVLVRARLCSRDGDTICAEQAWLDLDEGKGRYLPALVGLAGFRMAKGDRIGALTYVEKARRLSPGYLPARLFYEVGYSR